MNRTGDGCRQLVFTQRSSLRSSDVTRADTITLDVVSTVFGADVTSQHLQTTLSGSVCRYSLTTQFGHHGADVDDLTVTLLHHCRQNSLRNDERSIQVDVDNATEIGSFHFVHRDTADDTCVVNQNINRAHFFSIVATIA